MRLFVLGSFVTACCWNVARLPKAGETLTAEYVQIEAGGKGLNVAVGARRLGATVDIALGVGDDSPAHALKTRLLAEGIGIDAVFTLAPTSGYGAGLIAQDGQNAIAVYPGPNLLLTAEHMQTQADSIQQAQMVYGQFETSLAAIQAAFQLARANNIVTVLNPSPWQAIPQTLLALTDVMIVNEVEAAELLGLPPIAVNAKLDSMLHTLDNAAQQLFTRWPGQTLVVTLGAYGSVCFAPNTPALYCAAVEIIAKDTVGAGDAFAAGFCVSLLQGRSLQASLSVGNACGARVASQQGVFEHLPTQAQLSAFVEEYKVAE